MFVSGVWGPYFSAMLPGKFLSEGGQSATGSVVSHVRSHQANFFDKSIYIVDIGAHCCEQLWGFLHIAPYLHIQLSQHTHYHTHYHAYFLTLPLFSDKFCSLLLT